MEIQKKDYELLSEEEKNIRANEVMELLLDGLEAELEKEYADLKVLELLKKARVIEIE